eukprot:279103_1
MEGLPFDVVNTDENNLIHHTVGDKETITTGSEKTLCENILSKNALFHRKATKRPLTKPEIVIPEPSIDPPPLKRIKLNNQNIDNTLPTVENSNNSIQDSNTSTPSPSNENETDHEILNTITNTTSSSDEIEGWPSPSIASKDLATGKDYIELLSAKISTTQNMNMIKNKTDKWLKTLYEVYPKHKDLSEDSLRKMYYGIAVCIKLGTQVQFTHPQEVYGSSQIKKKSFVHFLRILANFPCRNRATYLNPKDIFSGPQYSYVSRHIFMDLYGSDFQPYLNIIFGSGKLMYGLYFINELFQSE